jgi:hypothetical protein
MVVIVARDVYRKNHFGQRSCGLIRFRIFVPRCGRIQQRRHDEQSHQHSASPRQAAKRAIVRVHFKAPGGGMEHATLSIHVCRVNSGWPPRRIETRSELTVVWSSYFRQAAL